MDINTVNKNNQISMKKKLSDEAKDILNLLLKKDPEQRIEPEQIIYHPFFSNYNYEAFNNKDIESPLKDMIKKINIPKFYFDQSDTYKSNQILIINSSFYILKLIY